MMYVVYCLILWFINFFPSSIKPKIVEKYYPSKHGNDVVKQTTINLQNMLEYTRRDLLFPIFQSLVLNTKSRISTMQFFTQALLRNAKRAQLQSDELFLSGDGFFTNLTTVLQILSFKIKRDNIDPYFPHSPDNLLGIKKEDSRIKFDMSEAENWLKEITSKSDFAWKEVTFSTECFFLTLYAHHLSVIPGQRKYLRRLRVIRELSRFIESVNTAQASTASQNRLRKCKEQMLKYHKAKLCAEAGFLDERFLGRCLIFYNQFINFLLKIINCDTDSGDTPKLPQDVSQIFYSYPDW